MKLRKVVNACIGVSLFPICACYANESRELARQVLNSIGFVEARLDLPWQHWQSFTAEQKEEFEEKCQYNRQLLEANLIDFLTKKFSDDELREIYNFHSSVTGQNLVRKTGRRGGFEIAPLNQFSSEWANKRYGEARIYAAAVMQNKEWTSPAYKGVVRSETATPDLAYHGTPTVDPIGKDEAYFNEIFGAPEERLENDNEHMKVLRLKATWRA